MERPSPSTTYFKKIALTSPARVERTLLSAAFDLENPDPDFDSDHDFKGGRPTRWHLSQAPHVSPVLPSTSRFGIVEAPRKLRARALPDPKLSHSYLNESRRQVITLLLLYPSTPSRFRTCTSGHGSMALRHLVGLFRIVYSL